MGNPYIAAWRRRARNRVRAEGVGALVRAVLVPAAVAIVAVPLLRPVFLGFLDQPAAAWGDGYAQVLLRAGLVLVGWLALDLYSAVVRGPEREVLARWPVDARQVVSFVVLQTAVRRWWLVPGALAVLSPVAAAGDVARWAVGGVVLLGAWAMALTAGVLVHLGAIALSESERAAGLLDLLRGPNPRAQAAFLYAPGVVLGVVGAVTIQAAFAVDAALAGDAVAAARLGLPFGVAAVAWALVPGLAARRWFDGTAVLAEIDARYTAIEEPEEAARVYLDGLAPYLPGRAAVYALRDLRHGWRARRTPITGAWLLGLAGFVTAWTADPTGPGRAAVVVLGTVLVVAAVGAAMELDEPPFLAEWLPLDRGPRALARVAVVCAWVQPCIWPAALAVVLRHGGGAALTVWCTGQAAALGACALVALCMGVGRRALVVYAPVATVVGAASAAWITGGLG